MNTTTTFKAVTAGAAITIVAVTGIAYAADAHASTYGELGDHSGYALSQELADDGYFYTSIQASDLAITACEQRSEGTSEQDLLDRVEAKYPLREAIDVVLGAEFHYCPQYATGLQQNIRDHQGSQI